MDSGGDAFPTSNDGADGYKMTCRVDEFPTNAYGLHNMIGNAWEWVINYWSTHQDSSVLHRDPTGPESGHSKVKKGVPSCVHLGIDTDVLHEVKNKAEDSTLNLGFRYATDREKVPNYLKSNDEF